MGNFLKGCIARAWDNAIAHFYNVYHADAVSLNRDHFQKGLIRQLWRMYESLWIAFSTQLHDPTDFTALTTIELDANIRNFYSRKRYHCGIRDQHLFQFQQSLWTMLQLPKQRKSSWLVITTEWSIIHSQQHTKIMQSTPPITAYFNHINEELPD